MDLYVQYGKGSIWKSTELAEKAISAPNRQGLPQKDVKGNINSTDKTIKDIRLTYTAHVDPTSEACQSGGQTIGMWETHGLMTRTDKANITTICNRGLCSTISITEGRFHNEIAPRFLNGDVAQMVECSLSMREVRGRCPASPIFQRSPEIKKGNTVSCFVRPKEGMDLYVQYEEGSIWNSTEFAEKGIGVLNHQGLPQKDVGGNNTILMSESKTSVWHKQLLLTPPARQVNREGKRLACEHLEQNRACWESD